MTDSSSLLLDTCAIIYLSQGRTLRPDVTAAITAASQTGRIVISPISAWEIGMAVARERIKTPLSALDFFNQFLARSGALLSGLEPAILVNASTLPGKIHKDPVDRILISSARFNDYTLVTSDRAILAYGDAGHVKAMPC